MTPEQEELLRQLKAQDFFTEMTTKPKSRPLKQNAVLPQSQAQDPNTLAQVAQMSKDRVNQMADLGQFGGIRESSRNRGQRNNIGLDYLRNDQERLNRIRGSWAGTRAEQMLADDPSITQRDAENMLGLEPAAQPELVGEWVSGPAADVPQPMVNPFVNAEASPVVPQELIDQPFDDGPSEAALALVARMGALGNLNDKAVSAELEAREELPDDVFPPTPDYGDPANYPEAVGGLKGFLPNVGAGIYRGGAALGDLLSNNILGMDPQLSDRVQQLLDMIARAQNR